MFKKGRFMSLISVSLGIIFMVLLFGIFWWVIVNTVYIGPVSNEKIYSISGIEDELELITFLRSEHDGFSMAEHILARDSEIVENNLDFICEESIEEYCGWVFKVYYPREEISFSSKDEDYNYGNWNKFYYETEIPSFEDGRVKIVLTKYVHPLLKYLGDENE